MNRYSIDDARSNDLRTDTKRKNHEDLNEELAQRRDRARTKRQRTDQVMDEKKRRKETRSWERQQSLYANVIDYGDPYAEGGGSATYAAAAGGASETRDERPAAPRSHDDGGKGHDKGGGGGSSLVQMDMPAFTHVASTPASAAGGNAAAPETLAPLLDEERPGKLLKTHAVLLTMDALETDLRDVSQTSGDLPATSNVPLIQRSRKILQFQDSAAAMWEVCMDKHKLRIHANRGDRNGELLRKAQMYDKMFQKAFANPFRHESCRACAKHPLEFAKIIEDGIERIRNQLNGHIENAFEHLAVNRDPDLYS